MGGWGADPGVVVKVLGPSFGDVALSGGAATSFGDVALSGGAATSFGDVALSGGAATCFGKVALSGGAAGFGRSVEGGATRLCEGSAGGRLPTVGASGVGGAGTVKVS